jgi:hypothetical protein
MGARFIYAKCSVIKYRGGTVVLYPLAKHQPEAKPLHGKKVHVIIITEEQHQNTKTNMKVKAVSRRLYVDKHLLL